MRLPDGFFPVRLRRRGDDGQSVTDLLAAVPERDFRPSPRHAAPQAAAPAPAPARPVPSFERHAATAPQPAPPALRRPYVASGSRPAAAPPPAPPMALRWLEAAEAAGREATGVLYAGPGWLDSLMRQRFASGEWENVQEIADRCLERHAADMAARLLRARAAINRGALLLCDAVARPDLAGPLLCRVQELAAAARDAAGGAR